MSQTTRIQEDAPHPDSYRPDLPLRSELVTPMTEEREDAYDEGFSDGAGAGERRGRRLSADRIAELEAENTRLRLALEKSA